MRILLTGGSGLLGKELRRLCPSIYAPPRSVLDIRDSCRVSEVLREYRPDIVIHAAAVTDNRYVVTHPSEAIRTNIEGTAHVAACCLDLRCRLVYLSTDYVYRGDRGNYRETDDLYPCNLYAWTKLGGEAAVRACRNHLIIRTSFGGDFQYREAFTDKWTSKVFVDEIAPQILEAALSTLVGVVNLGGPRKSVFSLVSQRNSSVKPATVADSPRITPVDTSLDLSRWDLYKRAEDRTVDRCRVCGRQGLEKYLDLGVVPLVNNLAQTREEALSSSLYPLQVAYCEGCSLSQTTLVISPQKMYRTYPYRSSVSKTFVSHCRDIAGHYVSQYGPHLSVLEIASNDGVLLSQFKDEAPGSTLLGIEPASNLASLAEAQGIKTLSLFWGSPDTTKRVQEAHPEGFDLIIGLNVFAHIDDVSSVLSEAAQCLSSRGRIAFEFPYLPNLIRGNQFDTIYHEHLSYFLLRPLTVLAERAGLVVSDATLSPIHGGSIRVEFAPLGSSASPSVAALLAQEDAGGFYHLPTYHAWSNSIYRIIQEVGEKLYELGTSGGVIYGFGASAKGNILLNSTGISSDLVRYIIDDTPEKIGKFSPGTGIPIVSRNLIRSAPPNYLLLLAWNFSEEIRNGLRDYAESGGKFITPVPSFVIG